MLKSLFTLGLIAIFASFAVRSHYAAMLMYWWFGIFRPHEWMWWNLSSLRLPLIAAFIFLVPTLLRGKFPRIDNSVAVILLAWALLVFASELITGCDWTSPRSLKYVLTLVVVVLLTDRVIDTRGKIFGLMLTSAFSLTFYTSKAGLIALVTGGDLYGANVGGGSFTGSNAVAMGAAMSLFMMIFVLQNIGNERGLEAIRTLIPLEFLRRYLFFGTLIVILGSVYFVVATQSRGTALALACALFVWVVLHPKRFKVLTVCIILLTSIWLFAPIPDSYNDRIASIFADEEDLDNSAISRPHFWAVAKLMAADYPLGVGIGCYQARYNEYDQTGGQYGRNRSVHSSHYGIIAEMGYPGFVLWLILLSTIFWKLLKARARARPLIHLNNESWFYFYLSNALISSLVVFVIGGSFYEFLYNDYTWIIVATTISIQRLFTQAEKPSRAVER